MNDSKRNIRAPSGRVLTAVAAEIVGCSADKLRDLVRAGAIPAYRPFGGTRTRYVFDRSDLEAFVNASRIDPNPQA